MVSDPLKALRAAPSSGWRAPRLLTGAGQNIADQTMAIAEGHERELMERLPPKLRKPFMDAVAHRWNAEA